GSVTDSWRAIAVLLSPLAASRTTRERIAKACAVFGLLLQARSCSSSSPVTVNGISGRPIAVPPTLSDRTTLHSYSTYFRDRTLDSVPKIPSHLPTSRGQFVLDECLGDITN